MNTNMEDIKRPVLFYYEEGVTAWVQAPDNVADIIDPEYLQQNLNDEVEIRFKCFMMSDNDLINLPED